MNPLVFPTTRTKSATFHSNDPPSIDFSVTERVITFVSSPDILRVPLFAALPVSHHVLRRGRKAECGCV